MSAHFTTLISASDLAKHLSQPNWIILDCRHDLVNLDAGRLAFEQGHLPNAQFANIDHDLSGPKLNADGVFCGRHPLPSRADFVATLRSWGINNDTQVIAYDAHGAMFAARLWWMLRWVGHEAVAVLDGGLPAWTQAQLAVSTDAFVPQAGSITEQPSLVELFKVDQIVANLTSKERLVIDARSPDRYRGENETMDPVGGHIPGAKNRFFKDNLQANGQFKSPAELRAEWSALINDPKSTIMQCGSGVTACHNLLALEVAGLSGAGLYAGSWNEWCSDNSRPVATGV